MADRGYFNEMTNHGGRAVQNIVDPKSRIIDFHIFKTEYWVKLRTKLNRNISVNLIFAEIMGVLKGSISSIQTLMPLSRKQYSETSCRLAPIFTTDLEREQIYEIYELYEKMKKERGEIDQLDRVIGLLHSLKHNLELRDQLGQAFEEIYVDGWLTSN